MKNASIFHGTGESPGHFWFPWTKDQLEKKGYKVWLPQLPDTDHPDIKKWLPFVLNNGTFNTQTVLIGHSVSSPLILSVLENIKTPIRQAILVAAFFEPLKGFRRDPMLQKTYNWEKIKKNCPSITIINSDNDPWGCDDKAGKKLAGNLDAKLIVSHDGHFGSETYNQQYKEFPLLIKLIT